MQKEDRPLPYKVWVRAVEVGGTMLLDPVGDLRGLLLSGDQQVVDLPALLLGETKLPEENAASVRTRVVVVPVNEAGEAGNDHDNDQNPDKHFSLLEGCT